MEFEKLTKEGCQINDKIWAIESKTKFLRKVTGLLSAWDESLRKSAISILEKNREWVSFSLFDVAIMKADGYGEDIKEIEEEFLAAVVEWEKAVVEFERESFRIEHGVKARKSWKPEN